jgi:hypothetical protein
MPGDVGTHRYEKCSDVAQFSVSIVEPRYHQGHDLHPEVECLCRSNSIENDIQSASERLITPRLEGLEIDLQEIEKRMEVLKNLKGTIAIRYVRTSDIVFLGEPKDLDCPLGSNEWFVIRARDDRCTMLKRDGKNLLCGDGLGSSASKRVAKSLGRIPILTIVTTVVASQHAETESFASREDVKERFLFDGINLKAGNVSMGNKQLSAFIEADFADSFMPGRYVAPMAAGKALDPILRHRGI